MLYSHLYFHANDSLLYQCHNNRINTKRNSKALNQTLAPLKLPLSFKENTRSFARLYSTERERAIVFLCKTFQLNHPRTQQQQHPPLSLKIRPSLLSTYTHFSGALPGKPRVCALAKTTSCGSRFSRFARSRDS